MKTFLALACLFAVPSALAAALPAAPKTALRGDHLVVDPEGGASFLTIQAAIDAASSGDVILVRPWNNPQSFQSGFIIDGKALTIRAAGDVYVGIRSARISGLNPDQTVTLRGFDVAENGTSVSPVFEVDQCQGSVHVQDCTFTQETADNGVATVRVFESLNVGFSDCEIVGGEGLIHATHEIFHPGGVGLSAIASRLTLARSQVTGGNAGSALAYSTLVDTPPGGTALRLSSRSVAWVEGTTLKGGAGFSVACHSNCDGVIEGGDGGTGAYVQTGSVLMRLYSIFEGGEGGSAFGSYGGNIPGDAGQALVGQQTSFPGRLRHLDGPDSVRTASDPSSGSIVPLRLTGVPGEMVTAWATEGSRFRALGGAGVLGVHGFTAAETFDLGIVPATGILEVTVVLPAELIREARTYGIQAGFRSSHSALRLTRVHRVIVDGGGVVASTPADVVYVAADAAPGGDGSSWASAASSLADVMGVLPFSTAENPVTVWVKEGRYLPTAPGGDRNVSFPLGSGWRILGGFRGDETLARDRDPLAYVTVLDGDLDGNDLPDFGNRDDNSKLVLLGTSCQLEGFYMDGFTVRGGAERGALDLCGSASFQRCVFEENRGDATAPSAVFYRDPNSTETDLLTFKNCAFVDNRAVRGSVLVAQQRRNSLELHGCLFARNTKEQYSFGTRAVAIKAEGSPYCMTEIANCTFADNRFLNDVTFQSCVSYGTGTRIVNSIFWNTHTPLGEVEDLDGGSGGIVLERNRFSFDYSFGTNNTTADPRFVGADNYRLAADSPLLDAGDNSLLPASLTRDLDGDHRIKNEPNAPNVGVGGVRIVDLGAYER